MSTVKTIEIYCNECDKWFPSPIFFGDLNSFDTSMIEGNKVQCPYHGGMIGCNKENMRVRGSDGGFKGKGTR